MKNPKGSPKKNPEFFIPEVKKFYFLKYKFFPSYFLKFKKKVENYEFKKYKF